MGVWDPGYGSMGPWIWDPGHGYTTGWALAIPDGYQLGTTPGTPSLYPPVLHQPATRYRALLNAIVILSKLQLVDIRFTICMLHASPYVSVRVQHASVNVPTLPECAYFPNRVNNNEVSQ